MLVKFYHKNERQVYDGIDLQSIRLEFIVPKDPESKSNDREEDVEEADYYLVNDMVSNAEEVDD